MSDSCDFMYFSLPGSSVLGISQARILEWVAISFFNTQPQFSSVHSLSCVQIFVTSWTAAYQASPSITNSQSLLRLMSIESVMPSNHLILCCPLLLPAIFPSIRSFPRSQFFTSGGQSIGVSASISVQKHQFFSAQLSL